MRQAGKGVILQLATENLKKRVDGIIRKEQKARTSVRTLRFIIFVRFMMIVILDNIILFTFFLLVFFMVSVFNSAEIVFFSKFIYFCF